MYCHYNEQNSKYTTLRNSNYKPYIYAKSILHLTNNEYFVCIPVICKVNSRRSVDTRVYTRSNKTENSFYVIIYDSLFCYSSRMYIFFRKTYLLEMSFVYNFRKTVDNRLRLVIIFK